MKTTKLLTQSVMCLASACTSPTKKDSREDTYKKSYRMEVLGGLTPMELRQKKKEAAAGNAIAANHIATHYLFYIRDVPKADYWSRRAARLGSTTDQYNLAVSLLEHRNERDKAEGMAWLSLAADANEADARERYKRLKREMDEKKGTGQGKGKDEP